MKILIVEDNLSHIENLKSSLKELNMTDYKIFNNFNDTVDYLDEFGIENLELVVCDHNFPDFGNDSPEGLGHQILFELNCLKFNKTFIHYSQEPCPEKYELKDKVNFISLKKELSHTNIDLIKEFKNIKKD